MPRIPLKSDVQVFQFRYAFEYLIIHYVLTAWTCLHTQQISLNSLWTESDTSAHDLRHFEYPSTVAREPRLLRHYLQCVEALTILLMQISFHNSKGGKKLAGGVKNF